MGVTHGGEVAPEIPPGGLPGEVGPSKLQGVIDRANGLFEGDFQKLVDVHRQLRTLKQAADTDWKQHSLALKKDCDGIIAPLKKLARRQKECLNAQGMLTSLFRDRAATKSTDPIPGCADTRTGKELVESPTCACAAGKESEGCKDVQPMADHVLLCSHLRDSLLPKQKLEQVFAEGGRCTVDLGTRFNRELLRPGQPEEFSITPSSEGCSPLLLLLNPQQGRMPRAMPAAVIRRTCDFL
mmetsp:Transcript_113962/g.221322  ORF Transcript_113962/g.221322 Transcript_113962/m.221322 type:complete len:240 (+) Transcript_113962:431-1150(+)